MKDRLRGLAGDMAAYLKTIDEDTYTGPASAAAVPGDAAMEKTADNGQNSSVAAVLDGLKKEVDSCRKCGLGRRRLNAVFGVGSSEAQVVFVGEGPGYEEDHRGEPFVGRAGQLLDKILASVDLSRQTVYIANIVKCHPMINPESPESRGNDRPPSPEEISGCRPYLERQLSIIKPKCIVTLGSVASKTLLGATQGITALRGKWYDYPGDLFGSGEVIKVLPTYHPAALLRNPNLKRDTWEDMKMLKAFLDKK